MKDGWLNFECSQVEDMLRCYFYFYFSSGLSSFGTWHGYLSLFQIVFNHTLGGPRGRVVKVADFRALNHSIISPLWVRASLGARVTCGTSQVLLAGVSGGFSPGTPVFAPPTD